MRFLTQHPSCVAWRSLFETSSITGSSRLCVAWGENILRETQHTGTVSWYLHTQTQHLEWRISKERGWSQGCRTRSGVKIVWPDTKQKFMSQMPRYHLMSSRLGTLHWSAESPQVVGLWDQCGDRPPENGGLPGGRLHRQLRGSVIRIQLEHSGRVCSYFR